MNYRPPYIPLYVLDFIGDPLVELMTTEELGAYVLLMIKAWHQAPPASLPNDDVSLAKWSRLSTSRWAKVKPRVLSCWREGSDGRLYQKRLWQEYTKLSRKLASHSERGRRGNEVRWNRDRTRIADGSLCDDLASPQGSQPEPEPEPITPLPPASGGEVGETGPPRKRETRADRKAREEAQHRATVDAARQHWLALATEKRREIWGIFAPLGQTAWPQRPDQRDIDKALETSDRFRQLVTSTEVTPCPPSTLVSDPPTPKPPSSSGTMSSVTPLAAAS